MRAGKQLDNSREEQIRAAVSLKYKLMPSQLDKMGWMDTLKAYLYMTKFQEAMKESGEENI